jgi:hypothetical protein
LNSNLFTLTFIRLRWANPWSPSAPPEAGKPLPFKGEGG